MKFTQDPIGSFPLDIAGVRTEEGQLSLRRNRPHVEVRLCGTAWPIRPETSHGVPAQPETGPYKIHTVLVDHGSRSIELPDDDDIPFSSMVEQLREFRAVFLASEAFSS